MKTKPTVNLNELIYLARMHDEDAYLMLFEQLEPEIRYVYFCCGHGDCSWEEWVSEAWQIYDDTLARYRQDGDSCFSSWFVTCLRSRARDLARRSMTNKRLALSTALPLDAPEREKDIPGRTLIAHSMECRVEETVLNRLICDQVLSQLSGHLKEVDMKILTMIRAGYQSRDIAKILSVPYRKVIRTPAHAARVYARLQAWSMSID